MLNNNADDDDDDDDNDNQHNDDAAVCICVCVGVLKAIKLYLYNTKRTHWAQQLRTMHLQSVYKYLQPPYPAPLLCPGLALPALLFFLLLLLSVLRQCT